jgi:glycosyltransferase involved in cell wall biosynthesis
MSNARGIQTGLVPDRKPCRDVLVLIPSYNAGEAVGKVVRETASLGEGFAILVVDDGSTDATAAIAREAGASVISHARNLGKGAALRTGFEYLLGTDLAAAVTLDADGQHAPAEIPVLIDRWAATGADIIIGTRRRDPASMPRLRILTNWLSSVLVSLAAGAHIDDSQSGFRLVSRRVVEKVRTTSRGYGAESEILIKAARGGFKIEAAPVSTIYGDERSYVHPFKQPVLFTWLILKSIVWRFDRSGRP